MRCRLWLAITVSVLTPAATSARTWYVPTETPTIQAGIDAATAGDTVLVSPGTYTGEGNRDIEWTGKDLVLRSEGGAALTVVDAEIGEEWPLCDIPDPHSILLLSGGLTQASTIEGFTFTRGGSNERGGAIRCADASPVVRDCVFDQNRACVGGGAIYSSGDMIISSCTFTSNEAALEGGAVRCGSHDVVESCVFRENRAVGTDAFYSPRGGAVHSGGSSTISDCLFIQNGAARGGALTPKFSTSVSHCIFAANDLLPGYIAGGGGAAMDVGHCDSPAVTHCTFLGNRGNGVSPGGVVRTNADLQLECCIMAYNPDAVPIVCETGTAALTCCDVYGNGGGDWVGCLTGQDTISGNFSLDPLFCDMPGGDFSLSSASPCVVPQLDPICGDYLGARGVGCGASAVAGYRVYLRTWGVIKNLFRLTDE